MNTASVSTLLNSARRTGCVHEDRGAQGRVATGTPGAAAGVAGGMAAGSGRTGAQQGAGVGARRGRVHPRTRRRGSGSRPRRCTRSWPPPTSMSWTRSWVSCGRRARRPWPARPARRRRGTGPGPASSTGPPPGGRPVSRSFVTCTASGQRRSSRSHETPVSSRVEVGSVTVLAGDARRVLGPGAGCGRTGHMRRRAFASRCGRPAARPTVRVSGWGRVLRMPQQSPAMCRPRPGRRDAA